jgi:hypothetical protein
VTALPQDPAIALPGWMDLPAVWRENCITNWSYPVAQGRSYWRLVKG